MSFKLKSCDVLLQKPAMCDGEHVSDALQPHHIQSDCIVTENQTDGLQLLLFLFEFAVLNFHSAE